ncbi:MAG: transporter substrate-binding domain-containing protein [Rhizobiales bacterium]|nr:transporter substrate-binding domain-containing protein [Hyphomicrobiales bacterium]
MAAADTPPDTLRIGSMLLPPWGQTDNQGRNSGVIYELNEEIGRRSGLHFTNEILPFGRMIENLKQGRLDLVSSQAHWSARAAGDRLGVQFTIDVMVAVRKNSGIETIEDLQGKDLVYHHAASYPQLEGLSRSIFRVNSYEQSVRMLIRRPEFDGIVLTAPSFRYWTRQLGRQPSEFKTIPLEINKKQWILVAKDMPQETRTKIKRAVDEIYQSDLYERLLDKHNLH